MEKLSLCFVVVVVCFVVIMSGNWRISDPKIVLVCGVLIPPLAIHSSYPSKKALFFLPKKFVKFQFSPGFVRSCLGKA